MGGDICIDVRDGQPEPGSKSYTITEGGSKIISTVDWEVIESSTGNLLISQNATGTNNVTETLVFKDRASLSTTVTPNPQTVTVNAYVTYPDAKIVKLSKVVKIQNQACCPGVIIADGAFTGSIPSTLSAGLSRASTLSAFSSATRKDLCWGPVLPAEMNWNIVIATSWCNEAVHGKGGDWDDGYLTWRITNVAELAYIDQAAGRQVTGQTGTTAFWSSTTTPDSKLPVLLWVYNSQVTYARDAYGWGSNNVRCVRTLD
jgi:hypothetical protein